MKRLYFLGVLLAVGCGDKQPPESLCEVQVPPPDACMVQCDPSTAANNCPDGFYCGPEGHCDAQCTPFGDECGDGNSCTADGRCVEGPNGGCTGLQCDVADCAAMSQPPTTLTGTVFAPNGTLPLYGVTVYVPNSDPGPLTGGVQCGNCADDQPGDPIATATTDDQGNFSLQGVPSGANIPLVITIGKWRRQITVSNVASCTSQAIAAVDTTLPKSRDDLTPNTKSVDMPKIAISTGSADSLECLPRRLGIADKEISTDAQSGTIHLFTDMNATANQNGVGVSGFDTGFAGGSGAFSDSRTLWGTDTDPGKLNNYDIVILSCEGGQHAETKSQTAMDHLKSYADVGGRVFLSHWHNIWLEGATQAKNGTKPAVWPAIATFERDGNGNDKNYDIAPDGPIYDIIDEVNNPKGPSFATWMLKVQSNSPVRGQVQIARYTGKQTAATIDKSKAEQWVYYQKDSNPQKPQMFQFSTPNEVGEAERCGKVVFSDMHVSGGPDLNDGKNKYPTTCGSSTTLTDQEKALAFMFFDISSCVGILF